jgi:hypothetical protein
MRRERFFIKGSAAHMSLSTAAPIDHKNKHAYRPPAAHTAATQSLAVDATAVATLLICLI